MSRHNAEDLLDSSPFEDDLQAELAARPGGGGPSKVTLALGAGVVLVVGLLAGIQAQKAWGTAAASATPTAVRTGGFGGGGVGGGGFGRGGFGRGGFGGGGFGGSARGSGGTAGNVTFGTVKLVDGDKIYVQTADGVVVVRTSGDTKIQVSRQGKVKDLKAGAVVVVSGPLDSEGMVNATSVSEGSSQGRGPAS
ncbi:hypothetical protein N5079_23980 [Planotetraspora sp. A-T 1434]|uniref:hypothetical protein n=1 Tax=Planotetraspora sp. A-T 1434 TaxID=2979219 RepID=UPI0021C1DC47|nr:hypothetical protein [Planotetraspora sp. A-T 1434]MCT9933275.1 hypothetical protein [Planotetraspora sp. A-T 1434]